MFRYFFLIFLFGSYYYIYYRYRNIPKLLFALLVFLASLRLGYILYAYNGILFMDIPMLILLFWMVANYKGFKFSIPGFSLLFIFLIVWLLISSINNIMLHGNPIYQTMVELWNPAICFVEITKYIRAYLLIIVVYNFVRWKKDINLVIDSILVAVFLHSLVGFYQWRFGHAGLNFLGEIGGFSYRVYGLFFHPVLFGDYLVLILPILLRLFYFHSSKRRNLFYGVALGFASLALLNTFARGSWIGLFLALAFMFSYDILKQNIKRVRKYALVVSVIFLFFFLIRYTPRIMERFLAGSKYKAESTHIRLPLIKVALRMIQHHPIFGVGPKTYNYFSGYYVVEDDVFDIWTLTQVVHNSYLLIAAETGIPGLLIFLGLMGFILRTAFKIFRSKDVRIGNIGKGIFWGYVAILIAYNGGPDYANHSIANTSWLLAGIVFGLRDLNQMLNRALKKAELEKFMQKQEGSPIQKGDSPAPSFNQSLRLN